MQLDSVRELKASLQSSLVAELAEPTGLRALGVQAGPVAVGATPARTLALGIVPAGRSGFRLAVRLQRRALEGTETVEAIRRQAKGEVDVRYIGRLVKRGDGGPFQQRLRPLRIGGSVGHFKITAGTLGAFVRDPAGGHPLILSNNHVLANENRAKKGDAILQPGNFDNGTNPADRIGTLAAFKRLKRVGANLVDCATAALADDGLDFNASGLDAAGTLRGIRSEILRTRELVHKVGRTTGVTHGEVTAIEMDNVVVDYDIGSLRFDQQIEIEGAGAHGFSAGGDSGSLIVDDDGMAVALLFAGGETGGTNDKGLTYANPLAPVLASLKVDLLF